MTHLAEDVADEQAQNADIAKQTNEELTDKEPNVDSKTGLIDVRMTQYWCITSPGHPECPERVKNMYQKLEEEDLIQKCLLLTPRLASVDEILLKHTKKHYDIISSVEDMAIDELNNLESAYQYTFILQYQNAPCCWMYS